MVHQRRQKLMRLVRSPQNQSGAVILEVTIVIGLLLTLLIVGIDFALFIYRMHVALYVSNEISRRAAVGNIAGANGEARAANVESQVIQLAAKLNLEIDPQWIRICPITPASPTATCIAESTGTRNGYFLLQIVQPSRTIIGVTLPIIAGAIVRNEPFRN